MANESTGVGDEVSVRKIPEEGDESVSRAAWYILAMLTALSTLGLWRLGEILMGLL